MILFIIIIFSQILRDHFEIDPKQVESIWHPNFDFLNLMKYDETQISGSTKSSTNMWYDKKSNHFQYTTHFQLTISCDFNFANFPFDSQECSLQFGSLVPIPKMILKPPVLTYGKWQYVNKEKPIILKSLSHFEIKLNSLPSFEIETFGSNFSFTGMNFTLKRKNMGQLSSGFYYPTTAFAILSMISFLINPDVVRGYPN